MTNLSYKYLKKLEKVVSEKIKETKQKEEYFLKQVKIAEEEKNEEKRLNMLGKLVEQQAEFAELIDLFYKLFEINFK